jgi:acyl-CoA reductase-like NAD-dependent aldehyde dehydrogenase
MEETFGPVIPIVRAPDNDDELIALSNSTAFGLSSGVCTNDFRRMQKYIAGLKVGTVNIWEVPGYRIEMSPSAASRTAETATRKASSKP